MKQTTMILCCVTLFATPLSVVWSAGISDITGAIPGAADILLERIDQQTGNQTNQQDEPSIEISIDKTTYHTRGNVESKIEIEHVKYFDAVTALPESRAKFVFAQGHVNYSKWPDWWLYYHLANEIKFDGGVGGSQQEDGNLILELNPRWQKNYGSGLYGLELGITREDRFDLTKFKVRPFIEYWPSDKCKTYASLTLSHTRLEAFGSGEPDFQAAALEPGFSCFLHNNFWLAGLNTKFQHGRNINDDDNAVFLDGSSVPSGDTTKKSSDIRFSPFLHRRFSNNIGLTLWAEFARVKDDARNDFFYEENVWDKYVAFIEYPLRPNFIIYGELSFTQGNKLIANANLDPAAFGYEEDLTYSSMGASVGFNYLF